MLSPLYQFLVDNGNAGHPLARIIRFTDSSFQDCPDTSVPTGGYLTFMQGAVVEAVSTMPTIVSQSTCEAEYCIASLAVMAGSYLKKFINEISGHYSNRPLTIPVVTDSLPERNQPARVTLLDDSTTFVTALQMVQLYCSIFKEPTTLLTASPSPL
jgi:hypothetical protein